MPQQTILITGVSSGLGKALAEAALAGNWRVIGTVRREDARIGFEALKPGHAFGRLLDLQDAAQHPDRAAALIADIEQTIAPIDVLVNNAGYGLMSTIEEAPPAELREQFEVNVFAQIAMLQAVLPSMRGRRAGRILNITSMGGLLTFPGVGIYNSTKFAMEGVTEVLRQEVAEFGIHVTAVEPGAFKTNWDGRSLRNCPTPIGDYDAQRKQRADNPFQWTGDPGKAAEAMLTILADPNPPGHLLLGSIATELVERKLSTLHTEIDAYRALSHSTDINESAN